MKYVRLLGIVTKYKIYVKKIVCGECFQNLHLRCFYCLSEVKISSDFLKPTHSQLFLPKFINLSFGNATYFRFTYFNLTDPVISKIPLLLNSSIFKFICVKLCILLTILTIKFQCIKFLNLLFTYNPLKFVIFLDVK